METFAITGVHQFGIARELTSLVEIEIPFTNKSVRVWGIWDTGATSSVISSNVVRHLGLVATGMSVTHGVHGPANVSTHIVNIGIISPQKDGSNDVLLIDGLQVTETEHLIGCDVLIGMDVICQGDFSVTQFGGRTMFSFRIPSQHHIDYGGIHRELRLSPTSPIPNKNDASRAKSNGFQGVGRNDPCPCGSGKKFKKCHGQ